MEGTVLTARECLLAFQDVEDSNQQLMHGKYQLDLAPPKRIASITCKICAFPRNPHSAYFLGN